MMIHEYNSQRPRLILPEYGRNLQKMVEHTIEIEDRAVRNNAAQTLVQIMSNINPHYKDRPDFMHKLWDHLAIISNFRLDVDYPYETPSPDLLTTKPQKVPYGKVGLKYKHYGRTIELLIEEAINMDDLEKKELLIRAIANHMKRLYLTWNNDQIIHDEDIYKDLDILSKGKLVIDRSYRLTSSKEIAPQAPVNYNVNIKRNNKNNKIRRKK